VKNCIPRKAADDADRGAQFVATAVGQADSLPPPFRRRFGCGYAAWYYMIFFLARRDDSWWDRRFACHRRL